MEALKLVVLALGETGNRPALSAAMAALLALDITVCSISTAPAAGSLHRCMTAAGVHHLNETLLVTDRPETATVAARAGWQVVALGGLPDDLLHALAGPRGPVLVDDAAELPALLRARAVVGWSAAPSHHGQAPITIRRAQAADAPVVLWLTRAAFAEHWGRILPPSGAHTETLARVCADVSAGAAVAEAGGCPVGSARFAPEGEDVMYLGRLAVLPGWRNRGVARRLMTYVEAEARRQGLRAVRLGTRAALRQNWLLYQRVGYRIVTEEPGADPPVTLMYWLRKELDADG